MPGTFGARTAGADGAIVTRGLGELSDALHRMEGPMVRKLYMRELRAIARDVRDEARGNVRSRSGDLSKSIRHSATRQGARVFSSLVYSGVQDTGGRVGRGQQTILRRGDVSQYMTRALRDSQPMVSRRLQGLLDTLTREFQK